MTDNLTRAAVDLPIAFYGDDFTGSSENLAQYHRHGLRAFLFLHRPSLEQLVESAGDHDVLGIAGCGRSLAPARLVEEITPAFRLFADAGARLVQYKVCSTFDSAAEVGNFATILQVARQVWPSCFIPVFAATPEFGRYTAFGNHFAQFDGEVFRLDRHPSMSRHPVTPMHEPDLRRILEEQGCDHVGLVDLRVLGAGEAAMNRHVDALLAARNDPIVFDGIVDHHCAMVGGLAWERSAREPVMALAAQGLAYGLGRYLKGEAASGKAVTESLQPVDRLLVLSGSCTPHTARQLQHFKQAGGIHVRLDAAAVLDPARRGAAVEEAAASAAAALDRSGGVALFTALGPDDPAIAEARATASALSLEPAVMSERIGGALTNVLRALSLRHPLRRVVFAGGDTSSYAAGALGATGLTIASGDYVSGSHVFKVAGSTQFDGMEIVLKGGQVGEEGAFARMLEGRPGTGA